MKEKIKLGYIGVGKRGLSVLRNCFSQMHDVEVKYVCDLDEKKLEEAKTLCKENAAIEPILTKDYHDILNDPEIDAVAIMTDWTNRPEMTTEAMRAKKYVAIEVGCADTIEECYMLLDVHKETGSQLMMLENCNYGRREMAVLNMVKQGLFGEIIHCQAGYRHFFNPEGFFEVNPEDENDVTLRYRFKQYLEKNRENYPTHGFGPVSKVLNINRGNRVVSLSSFSSKARALKHSTKQIFGKDSYYHKLDYKQGDIVNTILSCADGTTVLLTLDTTAIRSYYSRDFSVRGTTAFSDEVARVIFVEGMEGEKVRDNEEEMLEKYDHPLWKEYKALGEKAGHGGMDWLVCRAFIESAKAEIPTPIDIYDTLTWMAIGPLSEQSILSGGAPVEFPDFTEGAWENREPAVECKYGLETIFEDKNIKI